MADFKHHRYVRADVYTGSRRALIAAGIAKSEWFPCEPQLDKFGRTRRTFQVDDRTRICQYGPAGDRWAVHLETSPAERAARGKEERRLRAIEEQQKAESIRRRPLASPVSRDSLSDTELHHVRLLRSLTDRRRTIVLELANDLMYYEATEEESVAPSNRTYLQLVVDNERAR